MRAVVDRFEDGVHAVLLLVDDDEERVIPRDHLPDEVQEGDWLDVTFDGNTLVAAHIDAEATAGAKARISDKLDKLRTRGRRSSPKSADDE